MSPDQQKDLIDAMEEEARKANEEANQSGSVCQLGSSSDDSDSSSHDDRFSRKVVYCSIA